MQRWKTDTVDGRGRRTEGTLGLRSSHLPPLSPLGRLLACFRSMTWLLAGRETMR